MNKPTKWTPDEEEWIVDMWTAGLSASQCAEAFCLQFHRMITRNAVIGKVHRMGINRMGGATTPKKKRGNRSNLGFGFGPHPELPRKKSIRQTADVKAALRRYRPGRGVYLDPPKLGLDFSIKGCSWDKLEAGDCRCRWPIESGPEHQHGHLFCGEDIVPGLSYCEHHAKRAFPRIADKAAQETEAEDELVMV